MDMGKFGFERPFSGLSAPAGLDESQKHGKSVDDDIAPIASFMKRSWGRSRLTDNSIIFVGIRNA
jgi:hypothetical protein